MTNYREILRLFSLGLNNSEIAAACGCSRTAVIGGLSRGQAASIDLNTGAGIVLPPKGQKYAWQHLQTPLQSLQRAPLMARHFQAKHVKALFAGSACILGLNSYSFAKHLFLRRRDGKLTA